MDILLNRGLITFMVVIPIPILKSVYDIRVPPMVALNNLSSYLRNYLIGQDMKLRKHSTSNSYNESNIFVHLNRHHKWLDFYWEKFFFLQFSHAIFFLLFFVKRFVGFAFHRKLPFRSHVCWFSFFFFTSQQVLFSTRAHWLLFVDVVDVFST